MMKDNSDVWVVYIIKGRIPEAIVPTIFQMIGLAVMCWLFGDEDRQKENRKK